MPILRFTPGIHKKGTRTGVRGDGNREKRGIEEGKREKRFEVKGGGKEGNWGQPGILRRSSSCEGRSSRTVGGGQKMPWGFL